MRNNIYNKVLVLAPHVDDGEIGAGGLIKYFTEMGVSVSYLAFSLCEESIPSGFPKDILATEVIRATAHLGILEKDIYLKKFPVRKFNEKRQEILDTMLTIKAVVKPDLVLTPSIYDHHQDHSVVSQESIRAFKDATLLGYEIPWNNYTFTTNLIVELSALHIEAKMKAFSEYKSQSFRSYNADNIKSLASSRGLLIKSDYAEAFNIIRQIWK